MNAVLAQNHARRVNKRRGILAKNNAQKHFKGWQKQYYISKASVAKCMLVRIISEISNHACIGLDMSVYLINEYICMKNDLQLGKLKENCLLLKLHRKLRKMFLSPFIHIYSLIRYTDISRLLFSSTCMTLTNGTYRGLLSAI